MQKILWGAFLAFLTLFPPAKAQESDFSKYFPDIEVLRSNGPEPGCFLTSTLKHFFDTSSVPNKIMLYDNEGTPLYFRIIPGQGSNIMVFDGKLYLCDDTVPENFYYIDTMLMKRDTFHLEGDYPLSLRVFEMDEQGHYLLMGSDYHKVDMTPYGGDPEAVVYDFVLQEFDAAHRLLYTWRSRDHYHYLDCDTSYIDITSAKVDYIHPNSVVFDSDTSFLVSCRHLDEITKVDRRTGEILWHLGGKNNDFVFVNDTLGFNHQHSIKKLPNGNLLFFDNGNRHVPPRSSIVEYRLDEQEKKAYLVRRIWHDPPVFVHHVGSVEPLPGGNLLATWGEMYPLFTEFFPNGEVALEMNYPYPSATWDLKKTNWIHKVFVPRRDTVRFGMWDGYTESIYLLTLHNNTDSTFRLTGWTTRTGYFRVKDRFPVDLPPHGDRDIQVVFYPSGATTGYLTDVLTLQAEYPHLYLARQVFLTGRKEDYDPPQVIIVPDTTRVPRDAVVTVTFSEPVRLRQGDELNYLNVDTLFDFIRQDTGEPVPYNATVTTDKTVIRLFPADSLEENATYVVVLPEVLEDYSGNPVQAASATFSTGDEMTTTPSLTPLYLRLYPNPGSGIFRLEREDDAPVTILLHDLAGRVLMRKENVKERSLVLNLAGFEPGVYLLSVVDRGGRTAIVIKVILRK